MRKRGSLPTVYTEELAAALLELIANQGEGLHGACEKLGVARRTVRWWVIEKPDFAAGLAEARRQGLEVLADQIIQIGDAVRGSDSNAAVQAAKLACDNRRWLLSKLNPQQYGDKVEVSGTALLPANPEAQIPRLLQVLAVLLPSSTNSELFTLASSMVSKLKALEGPKANGAAED